MRRVLWRFFNASFLECALRVHELMSFRMLLLYQQVASLRLEVKVPEGWGIPVRSVQGGEQPGRP
jgi:hypothetical protein